jgi:hypothetical protein
MRLAMVGLRSKSDHPMPQGQQNNKQYVRSALDSYLHLKALRQERTKIRMNEKFSSRNL